MDMGRGNWMANSILEKVYCHLEMMPRNVCGTAEFLDNLDDRQLTPSIWKACQFCIQRMYCIVINWEMFSGLRVD